ncbi:MAG: endonuclease III [Chloroflexi bacterium]|nr:MAG: endonuclease III [Chloroflexota bacterium]
MSEVLRLLREEYGERRWQPHRDPVSTLVATILSQNTSDANSSRAFHTLMAAFGGCESVAAAPPEDLAGLIRTGGLAEIKAGRITLVLQEIQRERGSLDLDFLKEMPLAEARSWLMQLPGVGPKTASCVLLFSLGRPALPVDTHVLRVSRRLGLIDSRTNAERAHRLLEGMIPAKDVYSFHLNVIEHGRRVCRAQRPRCGSCVLREICPSASFWDSG